MKRHLIIVLVLLLITASVSLAESGLDPISDGTITYSVNEAQSALTVELAGNATTGYEWFCAISPESLLSLTSSEYIVDESAEAGMAGVGGKSSFVFQPAAKETGMATLVFTYKKSWETEVLLTYEMDGWVDEAGLLSVVDLRKSPPLAVGDIIDCPQCGTNPGEVAEVRNGGEEDDGTLWEYVLECPECGTVVYVLEE